MSRRKKELKEDEVPLLEEDYVSIQADVAVNIYVDLAKRYFVLEKKLYGNELYDFYSARVKDFTQRLVCLKIWRSYLHSVKKEKKILKTLDGNQFPKLLTGFDYGTLRAHLVMDYFGEETLVDYFRKKRKDRGKLCKRELTFFIANMVLAIEKMHAKGYFHAALAISQMFLDKDRYLKIVNFSQAGNVDDNLQYKWTLEKYGYYFPIEMLIGMKYGKPADIWMLGICSYVLMVDKYPFNPVSDTDSKRKFAVRLTMDNMNVSQLTPDEAAFVRTLLVRDPRDRLTIEQVKKQPFFDDTNFESIDNKTYRIKGCC